MCESPKNGRKIRPSLNQFVARSNTGIAFSVSLDRYTTLMFTSKRLLLLLALPLIASQALAGHPRLPYRACVAVLDANGAGQMTCALRQCVENDSRANPDLNAFAQACNPRNPTRCLSLRVVPGCGGEKALLMHDFAKAQAETGSAPARHCR